MSISVWTKAISNAVKHNVLFLQIQTKVREETPRGSPTDHQKQNVHAGGVQEGCFFSQLLGIRTEKLELWNQCGGEDFPTLSLRLNSEDFYQWAFLQINITLLLNPFGEQKKAGWILIFLSTCLQKTLITVDTDSYWEEENKADNFYLSYRRLETCIPLFIFLVDFLFETIGMLSSNRFLKTVRIVAINNNTNG